MDPRNIQIYVNGTLTEVRPEDETFERTLSLEGTYRPDKHQKRAAYIGNQVKVPGYVGWDVRTVLSVSTDRQSWRDEYGDEHYTVDILL
jgi:hypothetical protein